ncbi:hypothetical protein LRS13_23170 [Svornostia abyssi]|uniref:Uncharacterized protein n=1 Tax=Svornostia abyssi TaxID=2898438 RepID=A0ABY5PG99_9ACTN|nr:hypothetical protein LRS13_23170 [Parviterribacteraceae bacterium J379]
MRPLTPFRVSGPASERPPAMATAGGVTLRGRTSGGSMGSAMIGSIGVANSTLPP